MAISVNYTPIQQGLGLARDAGEGVRRRYQQQADLDFINLMSQMQARNDQAYANEISLALDAQQGAARTALANRELDANVDLRNRQLAQEAEQARVKQGVQQQELAQQSQQREAAASFVNASGTPADKAYFAGTGKVPETLAPQNRTPQRTDYAHDPKLVELQNTVKVMQSELDNAQRALSAAKTNTMLTPSKRAAEIAHYEQMAMLAREGIQRANNLHVQRLQELQRGGGLSDLGPKPQVVQQMVQQSQQAAPVQPAVTQSAPDQQPRIVRTGTDSETGRRVALLSNGQVVFVD